MYSNSYLYSDSYLLFKFQDKMDTLQKRNGKLILQNRNKLYFMCIVLRFDNIENMDIITDNISPFKKKQQKIEVDPKNNTYCQPQSQL